MPLYIVCGEHLLGVRLRPANLDASAGSREEIERIVGQIRRAWPHTRIILRADSGFCREALLSWCEAHQVDYVFGLARNERLRRIIDAEMQQAAALQQGTGHAARVFTEFAYQTKDSWSCPRRVVAKAEQIEGKENPRYVDDCLASSLIRGQLYLYGVCKHTQEVVIGERHVHCRSNAQDADDEEQR